MTAGVVHTVCIAGQNGTPFFQGEEDKDGRPAPAWAAQEQRGAANSAGLFGWSYTPHTLSLLFTPPPLTTFRAAQRAADPPPPTPLFPHLCFTPA